MRRPAGVGAWRPAVAAGALLAGLVAVPAGAHPRFLLSGGRTFAILADSQEGGPSRDLRALWFTVSAGLAADAHPFANRSGPVRGLFANGTAGPYLVRETQFGNQLYSHGALGWSLGGGWRTRLGDRATAGGFVQYHRVFNDRLGRFMSAGLEWSWR